MAIVCTFATHNLQVARYFIELGYQGTRFHGWQAQHNAGTVQQTLDQNLSMLLQHTIESTGCGRTDTGVHASQFFAHFETDITFDATNAFVEGARTGKLENAAFYAVESTLTAIMAREAIYSGKPMTWADLRVQL